MKELIEHARRKRGCRLQGNGYNEVAGGTCTHGRSLGPIFLHKRTDLHRFSRAVYRKHIDTPQPAWLECVSRRGNMCSCLLDLCRLLVKAACTAILTVQGRKYQKRVNARFSASIHRSFHQFSLLRVIKLSVHISLIRYEHLWSRLCIQRVCLIFLPLHLKVPCVCRVSV